MEIIHREIIVKGRVQGVYFRATAKSVADELGIKGEVKNTRDGNVWIAAEASEGTMQQFLEWCRQGPARAEVKEIVVSEGGLQHYTDFTIGRTI